ncbi:MAG: YidC/Oxa1 family insertase periplasmic-domain containing protein [Sedimentisphaerales bacterium]|nr:YidC/Oxa1 family insertase periplasmic-domain containing protein [Sedimentisphaerales bacterium]
MNLRTVLITTIIYCGVLCGLQSASANDANEQTPQMRAAPVTGYSAVGGPARIITLGSLDPNTGFKFLLDLTTRGAAIEKATLSEFDDLQYKDRPPLVLLSPATAPDGSPVFSTANQSLVFTESKLQLPLDKLEWDSSAVITDGARQSATFEAFIKDKATGQALAKLTKTYTVEAGIYHVDCNLAVENLSQVEQKLSINMTGPVGINQEDPRSDTRKVFAAFRNTQGQIDAISRDIKKLQKAQTTEQKQLYVKNAGFLWAGVTNKYFAAIVVPQPESNTNFCNWIADKTGWFVNADNLPDSGDETIGIDFKTTTIILARTGEPKSRKNLDFKLFIGPKYKSLFDKTKLYKDLAFTQIIDFMSCCCPTAIIHPLGFGILALMKLLHGIWPHNYGIVIIILVLLVRLILHPLTRKSQVSMSEYSKFNMLPEVQEIRKQYGKDMMEMNRRIAEVQKKYGVSHSAAILGMLPMMVQMPIWIALYGAIYASIDLRGAPFLPVWITDLSAPDALFRFRAIALPLFGKLDSFNLLPILMAVAFYLQQKLTPQQAASPDPQTAQQQKIMMLMMTIMFPLMLYKAPSGLNLYIMTSVFGGVVEQYFIKKHIREKEQAKEQGLVAVTAKTGGKIKKKKPKPFFKT